MSDFEKSIYDFSLQPPLDTSADSLDWVKGVSANVLCCVNRHFAVASDEIARDDGISADESARYRALSAMFRALIEARQGLQDRPFEAGPVVAVGDGRSIPLVAIFLDSCREYRLPLPSRSIDPGLVFEAKALLRGVQWSLP